MITKLNNPKSKFLSFHLILLGIDHILQIFLRLRAGLSVVLVIYTALISTGVYASPSETEAIEELKKMTKHYSKTSYLVAKFRQKQIMELLGDVKSAKGTLYYSNQKLRIELQGTEQNSVTLFTPGVITSISYDKDSKPTQVLKSKPYPHPLLNLMFGDYKTWDKFEVTEIRTNNKTILDAQVIPKDAKELPGIDRIDIMINKKKSELVKIVYWDEIGNKTINTFASQKTKGKIDGTKFVLVPPQGVEVKNL